MGLLQPRTNLPAPLIADDVYQIVQEHKERLDSAIIYDRDFSYEFFGFKTLERSYLYDTIIFTNFPNEFSCCSFISPPFLRLKLHGKIAERPQHMLMRVAIGIHKRDLEAAIETYNLMSERWFTHASPTMFNAGTPHPQVAFLNQTPGFIIERIGGGDFF